MSTQPHNTEPCHIEGEEIELQLTPFESIAMWLSIGVLSVLTVAVVCGGLGFLFRRLTGA